MEKRKKDSKRGNLAISILLVTTLSLTAAILLLFAFVIWLSDLLHSLTLSLLLTGSTLALLAWITYKITLSPTLKKLRKEYEYAMTLISTIKSGYECIINKISHFLYSIIRDKS